MSTSSRLDFLTAFGLTSVGLGLAGCSGNSLSPVVKPPMLGLSALMRGTGVSYAIEKGIIYRADGSVGAALRSPQCLGQSPWARIQSGVRTPQCNPPGDNPANLVQIGCTSTSYGPVSLMPATNAPGYFGLRAGVGAEYGIADKPARDCRADLLAAAGSAWGMVTYMRANAGSYSAAMNNAVNSVFNKYQGTTMGIAAALEFILAVMAGLSIPEVLIILAGASIAIGAIWVMIDCYKFG